MFKAKNGGKIEKELKKDEHVLNKLCFVSCNENSWATDKIMADLVSLLKKRKYL